MELEEERLNTDSLKNLDIPSNYPYKSFKSTYIITLTINTPSLRHDYQQLLNE